MKKIIVASVSLVVIFALFSILKPQSDNNNTSRSFYMGFSTWPSDFDLNGINKSFELTNKNSDIRLIQIDGGVPWVELSNNNSIPSRLLNDWNYSKDESKDKKIFVAITPLDGEHSGLALWANDKNDNQPLPDVWKNVALNSDKVKKAYLTYAEKIIDFWNPDYFAIGIEVNILANKDQEKWEQYVDLHTFIYKELKRQYPDLPIFATIQTEQFKGLTSDAKGKVDIQKKALGALLSYEDIIAISVYPYMSQDSRFDNSYFDDLLSYAKPLAISETGWPSETLTTYGTTIKGSEESQVSYLQNLLELANKDKFVFVVNWVNVDYDKLLEKLPKGDITELAKVWVHDGLWDANFTPKLALKTWQDYFSLPLK